MSYAKKLIEVALPLEDINAASAREKSIRHGHPSTLHLWWARRPLAAARAVLFSQLVDDPSGYVDELRNNSKLVKKSESELKKRLKDWRDKKELFDQVQAGGGQGTNPGDEPILDAILVELERERLFNMIRELVLWENTTNERVLEPARKEIQISWKRTCRREGKPEDTPMPPFLDPFAGGGAIPLEAQRLGLEAHASDLNPVAVLINKAMIEIPPKFADMPPIHPKARQEMGATGWKGAAGLAEDVRRYGVWMRDEAFKRIGHLYPPYVLTQEILKKRSDLREEGYQPGDELTVIAWLWARTVPSPNPALNGKHVPLVSSFWVSLKKGQETYIEPVIEKGDYRFEIRIGKPLNLDFINQGTKTGSGDFKCLLSGIPIKASYNREQGQAGNIGVRPLAIVCEGKSKRVFLDPTKEHEDIAHNLNPNWQPTQEFFQKALGFRVGNYGYKKWGDVFTDRQLVALETFCSLVGEVRELALSDAKATKQFPDDDSLLAQEGSGSIAYADSISIYLSLGVGRLADYSSSLCGWIIRREVIRNTYGRQALSMTWDFAETSPFSGSSGNYIGQLNWITKVIEKLPAQYAAKVSQANASTREIIEPTIVSSDPPYYDNIGYADLSDFFYVWLRKALQPLNLDFFGTMAVPKAEELVATPARHGGKEQADIFFMEGMKSFASRVATCSLKYPSTIYYAFKQSEIAEEGVISQGWASFLEALVSSGISVVGTWPSRTELSNRMRGQNSNALASSIVLVCRKRPKEAIMATRKEFVQALQRELPLALSSLQHGNIAPVDLPQSSIGPGMAIFSRYSKVVEADGLNMPVRTALQLINQAVDEYLSEQEASMDDWTRFSVTWFSQHCLYEGPFGDAQNLATARNVTVDGVEESGIIQSGGGKVRLLKRDELDPNWDPITDTRLTVWEVTHYLIRELLDGGGEIAAAKLLKKVGGLAEDAKGLAYRLYTICEQNKWAELGRDYNMLVTLWPELVKQSQELESEQLTQSELEI